MEPNPYESPADEQKPNPPGTVTDIARAAQWLLYLLLLIIAIAGVLVPVLATIGRN